MRNDWEKSMNKLIRMWEGIVMNSYSFARIYDSNL
jgi:hypothetical protein